MQIKTENGWKALGDKTITVTELGQHGTLKTVTENGFTLDHPIEDLRCQTREMDELLKTWENRTPEEWVKVIAKLKGVQVNVYKQ